MGLLWFYHSLGQSKRYGCGRVFEGRKLKFALVGPVYPYRGGIAHYTTMLCRTLRERGHEVLLVSFNRQYPQWLFPGQSDKDPSNEPLRVTEAHYWIDSLNPITWLLAFWRIWRYKPDALVLQWWTVFWAPEWFLLGGLQRLLARKPLLIICHNVLSHEGKWWDRWLARAVLGWGSQFIVQSGEEQSRLISILPHAQVIVVPLPVFSMFAAKQIPKREAREKLKLPQDIPVLLFFGIVREYKGLIDLLRAMPRVVEEMGRILLIIAGEFWEPKDLYLQLIKRLGIEESVLIENCYIPNEQVPLYFSAADLVTVPYRRVTGSGVVQLALGFGVPLLTTSVGNLSQAVGGACSYLVVPPGDSEAIAHSIITYFSDSKGGKVASGHIDEHSTSSWNDLVFALEGMVNEAHP